MTTIQPCPNCHRKQDVAVYVTGQRARCTSCGISFEVRRTDVSSVMSKGAAVTPPTGHAATRVTGAAPLNLPLTAVARAAPQVSPVVTATPAMVAGTWLKAAAGAEAQAQAAAPADSREPGALPPVGPGGAAPVEAAPAASPVAVPAPSPVPAPVPEPERHGAGTANTVITPPLEKMDLPGYELLEVLGRGGMGEVWKARQRSLGRIVAVKVLPPKLARDPEFVTRFEKEATALASLSHPNIIQIIDRGVAGEHYYFAMEYVSGRSLRDVMNAGRLGAEDAVRLISQICRAIDYAHEAGIIHRDLKPENILIDDRGHVKVADFGLAGIRGDQRLQLTATRVAMGTVNYMAPEQRRDAKHVDGRADLYSLGVMLYELLTGELPLGRFRLPSERVEGLDLRLDDIVARTLESDPQARFQRASEIGRALESMISSTPTSGVPLEGLPSGTGAVGGSENLGAEPGGAPLTTRDRPRAATGGKRALTAGAKSSLQGLKTGLAVVGALALIAFGARWANERLSPNAPPVTATSDAPELSPPPNTNGELFVVAQAENGGAELATFFAPAGEDTGEELNAHAGDWRLEAGRLRVSQAGNELSQDKLKLVPRAYVAHRYYSADDFTLEVLLNLRPLEPGYGVDEEAQRFAEVAFRIKDLQVSAFAIPGVGMRLGWRYYTAAGEEIQGNSARDVSDLTEDEMPVPMSSGPFRVTLRLRKMKGGVEATAFVNDQRFARKILPGLEGQVGKVALGCRNLHCEFASLGVRGKAEKRPGRRPAAVAPPARGGSASAGNREIPGATE